MTGQKDITGRDSKSLHIVSSKFIDFNSFNELTLHHTGQIYVRGIFVENSHDIFPEYSEKVSYEIPGNIPK